MPETIRANERLRSRRRGNVLAGLAVALCAGFLTAPVHAEAVVGLRRLLPGLSHEGAASLSLTFGLVCFAVLATIALMRARSRADGAENAVRDEVVGLRSEIDRLKALLLSEPQVLIAWNAGDDLPDIFGDTTLVVPGAPSERVLAFGLWLDAATAQRMQHAVDALRADGRGFVTGITTISGLPMEAEGRAVGGRAVLRLREVGGIERDLIDLAARYDSLLADVDVMRMLLDSLPVPVWARDADGELTFVNAAYAQAVEAADPSDAVTRKLELLDRPAREETARARAAGERFAARVPVIVAGERRSFDVIDAPSGNGRAGIAIDRTEAETMRAGMARLIDAHRRVLDQLAAGVAIFAADGKLAFYNAAFRSLFELDAGFLDQNPTDGAVLDAMRAARKLPEEQDFRQWKAQLHQAYRALEAKEQLWHLPDGRTVRVVATPNPEGGVTYLYDDVTERLELHRRYDALIKVQSETLDHLAEAVAVFGSDGRVRLHNPAFARMWKLQKEALDEHPHVDAVTAWTQALHDDNSVWRALRAAVTAIDNREPLRARIERRDGTMIDLSTMPLPDGATLVTFEDVTATFNVERALRERNEALEQADGIKIGFVHHVSYELRSPLTNIIGFAHFLGDPAFGPLTDKQREYLGYITASTNALLALTNNILDLATIDAGAMTLTLSEVDIRASVEAAAEGVQDRLAKDRLTLDIQVPAGIGSFTADERRLRQVLFNLLSNAVGFSPSGATVTISAERRPDAVAFSVVDRGPGIAAENKERVFELFETDSRGSAHRGPGLGLPLVRSFVELHGGSVTIDSVVGQGTMVTCVFPVQKTVERSAA